MALPVDGNIPTLEEINALKPESYFQSILLVDKLGFGTRGLNTIEDVKEFLRLRFYSDHHDTNKAEEEQREFMEQFNKAKSSLPSLVDSVEKFFKQADVIEELTNQIDIQVNDWKGRLKRVKEELGQMDFPILVAGEAKAGKSSFINLLLGADVLPVDHITCTRIICNIKNGSKKKVVLSQSPELKQTLTAMDQHPDLEISLENPSESNRSKIRQYISAERCTERTYDQACFFWPLSFLQENIYIVDSPGIRDTGEMNAKTLDFLKKRSVAFIFIFNAGNAGGINKWVEDLLEKANSKLKEINDDETDTKKAIFVFNQWDKVVDAHKNEEESLRANVLKKLKEMWRGVDVNKQVFFLSSMKVRNMMSQGAAAPQAFRSLKGALQDLMIKTLDTFATSNFKFLDRLLQVTEDVIWAKIKGTLEVHFNKIDHKVSTSEHIAKLKATKETTVEKSKELVTEIDRLFNDASESLWEHLKSPLVVARLTEISQADIVARHNMDLVILMIKRLIRQKIEHEIFIWNSKTNKLSSLYDRFEKIYNERVEHICFRFEDMTKFVTKEDLIYMIRDEDNDILRHCNEEVVTKFEKAMLLTTFIVLIPVVAVGSIFAAPLVAYSLVQDSHDEQRQLERFQHNKDKYIRECIMKYLSDLTPDKVKEYFFERMYKKFIASANNLRNSIERLIESKQKMLINLEEESRSTEEVLRVYRPILTKTEHLFGELHMIRLRYTPEVEAGYEAFIDSYLDSFPPPDSDLLVRGTYASIYRCQKNDTIVLRIMNQYLTAENARRQVCEMHAMRTILSYTNQENILRWCRFIRVQDPPTLVHVMEACDMSLREYFTRNSHLIPGIVSEIEPKTKALLFCIDLGFQLASVLNHMHNMKLTLVHKDLRMDNILVVIRDKRVILKLCDFGFEKSYDECLQTDPSTRSYVPPEVFMDQGAYKSSDIYGFGIFLWEIYQWEFFSSLPNHPFVVGNKITKGTIKVISFPDELTPLPWRELIQDCVSSNPGGRPCAVTCFERLEQIRDSDIPKLFEDAAKKNQVPKGAIGMPIEFRHEEHVGHYTEKALKKHNVMDTTKKDSQSISKFGRALLDNIKKPMTKRGAVKAETKDQVSIEESKQLSLDETRQQLPIYSFREDLMKSVEEHPVLIIHGDSGCGKTTQIPEYLFEAGYCKDGKKIACTQPYQLTATSAAARVSQEMSVELGEQVGYSIRFKDRTSNRTLIKYMVDEMLLREVLTEPDLASYSVVIIDEAHERTLHTDILLGLVKDIVCFRKDLKLLVISATKDANRLLAFFHGVPQFRISGRSYPVAVSHIETPTVDYVEAVISSVIDIHLNEPPGDILVFVAGKDDIKTARYALLEEIRELGRWINGLVVCSMYPALPWDKLAKVFEKTPKGARKVVLTTSIAESSLTFDGIKYVVDTGFCRQRSYNPHTGMNSFVLVPISKTTANQRSQRAGEGGPGKCFRLYTTWTYQHELQDQSIPEIQRTNLSSMVLLLKALGIDDLVHFAYVDRPPNAALMKALEQLYAFGALNHKGQLTNLGRKMAQFPCDPMMSKMIIAADKYKCTEEIITIAAMLTESNEIFCRPKDKILLADAARKNFYHPAGDHLTLLSVYDQWVRAEYSIQWCYENVIQYRSMERVRDIRDQFFNLLNRVKVERISCAGDTVAIRKAITTGYFYNTARLSKTSYKTVKQNQAVAINPNSSLIEAMSPCVIYFDLIFTAKQYMRQVVSIDYTWLAEVAPHYKIKESTDEELDKTRN